MACDAGAVACSVVVCDVGVVACLVVVCDVGVGVTVSLDLRREAERQRIHSHPYHAGLLSVGLQ